MDQHNDIRFYDVKAGDLRAHKSGNAIWVATPQHKDHDAVTFFFKDALEFRKFAEQIRQIDEKVHQQQIREDLEEAAQE